MKNTLLGKQKGFSQIELLIGVLVMSIFFLAIARVFYGIGRGVLYSKNRTIANNLAQEKIESLKNISYARLRVTTAANLISPGYDNTYYPPETNLYIGDVPFIRMVTIYKVEENSGSLSELAPTASDTGLKKIKITVTWKEEGLTKQLSVTNLREDPNRKALDGKITGKITDQDNGSDINKAQVAIVNNLNWDAYTDVSGNYELNVATGIYQIVVSKHGYFSKNSGNLTVGVIPVTQNLTLKAKATGHTTGYVFINEHLLISKVIADSNEITHPGEEAIELYNPTPSAITINNGNFKFKHIDKTNVVTTITVDYINTTIPAYGYFLLANTGTITLNGGVITRTADAKYSAAYGAEPHSIIEDGERGGVSITDITDAVIDSVGWTKNSVGQPGPPNAIETAGVSAAGGLMDGELIYRKSAPDYWLNSKGAAYDSNNNSKDFFGPSLISGWFGAYAPMNISFTYQPISGTPAAGAIISCNDDLSSPTTAYIPATATFPVAYFDLSSVSTGTWTVAATYEDHYQEVTNVTIMENAYTGIPNAATTPVWPMANYYYLIISSPAVSGYVSGQVTVSGSGISGITVGSGITSTTSGGDGRYYLGLSAGASYYITANQGTTNANYTEYTSTYPVPVNLGQITSGINLPISCGGNISGNVKIGSDNLQDVMVKAVDSFSNEKGSAVTDINGNFTLEGLSTTGNPYTVSLLLDNNETSTPASYAVTVVQGATQAGKDFTIDSTTAKASGVITENGARITTGVLLIATTSTITGDPPDINYSLRTGSVVYYSTEGLSDGTYQLNLRSGSAPTTYNVYGWYTKFNGTSGTTTTRRNGTVTVNAGASSSLNLGW